MLASRRVLKVSEYNRHTARIAKHVNIGDRRIDPLSDNGSMLMAEKCREFKTIPAIIRYNFCTNHRNEKRILVFVFTSSLSLAADRRKRPVFYLHTHQSAMGEKPAKR
jgi:hypothetical protein